MRRLITKEQKEKKATRNKAIIGIVLVLIMTLSTVGYALFSGDSGISTKITYNGIKFTMDDNGLWQFNLNGGSFLTYYNPKEIENVSVSSAKPFSSYQGKKLFILGLGPAMNEISRNIAGYALKVQTGCIEGYEDKCNENDPIKDCSQDNVIIIEESNQSRVVQNQNCIFIQAPYDSQTMAADAFIFKTLGVN